MTDTSPAAIKAWALRIASNVDFLILGNEHDKTNPHRVMFRAVAALAARAEAVADVQREEDAALCDRRSDEARAHAEHSSRPSVAALYMEDAALNDRLVRYAREGGWRGMDSAPRDTPLLLSDGRSVVVGCWYEGASDGAGWYLVDALPRYFPTHWRPLPAPPEENDDGR